MVVIIEHHPSETEFIIALVNESREKLNLSPLPNSITTIPDTIEHYSADELDGAAAAICDDDQSHDTMTDIMRVANKIDVQEFLMESKRRIELLSKSSAENNEDLFDKMPDSINETEMLHPRNPVKIPAEKPAALKSAVMPKNAHKKPKSRSKTMKSNSKLTNQPRAPPASVVPLFVPASSSTSLKMLKPIVPSRYLNNSNGKQKLFHPFRPALDEDVSEISLQIKNGLEPKSSKAASIGIASQISIVNIVWRN